MNYTYSDYTHFCYYVSLCVMMATIATCSIAERTNTDTYIFFSFVTSGFIFPIGVAWCWNDGWLVNIGFIDYGGASIAHIMGGLAGFMGTYLIGPRVGLFKNDDRLAYILDEDDMMIDCEKNLENLRNEAEIEEQIQNEKERGKKINKMAKEPEKEK